ncbi:MAG: hypothetical protein AAF533_08050 [Acidobacteriota bacterium]
MKYKPRQRPVTARLLTSVGWLEGTFHVPCNGGLQDLLNREADFIALTDVRTSRGTTDFMSLRRDGIVLVLPSAGDEVLELATHHHVDVSCLTDFGRVNGELLMLRNLRVSDYFARAPSFLRLERCRVENDTPSGVQARDYAEVLLGTRHVQGVSEQVVTDATTQEPRALAHAS